jgi:hypothetical protein
MPLTIQNIESELSYSYLHAVASKAGMNCQCLNRHSDNNGIDAQIDFFGDIPDTYITDVTLRVQLKSTVNFGRIGDTHISYAFQGIEQYDGLRSKSGQLPRILILLCLPKDQTEWLKCTTEQLILKEAAYWLCLYGAEPTANLTSITLYFPMANLLTPDSLIELAKLFGQNKVPQYIPNVL